MKTHLNILFLIILFLSSKISALDLKLKPGDIYIKQNNAGLHIFIKKKQDINSVLLTDSTKDPKKKSHVYALRSPNFNSINGNEKQMLDGKFIDRSKGIYTIIDSTTEKKDGDVFHLFVPYTVLYGYPWSRQGEITIQNGTFLNIRCFSKPFGDYSGNFIDNPFILRINKIKKEKSPEHLYSSKAVENFTDIAEKGGGEIYYAENNEDLTEKIGEILDNAKGKNLDLVLALDTTKSMKYNIPYLKRHLVDLIKAHTSHYDKYRIGLVYYKDYTDEYLVKTFPFESNLDIIDIKIKEINVKGGKDKPEAVYEALYESVTAFKWSMESRIIILIGDAPSHPEPRGKITQDMVYKKAEEYQIKINTIILPE